MYASRPSYRQREHRPREHRPREHRPREHRPREQDHRPREQDHRPREQDKLANQINHLFHNVFAEYDPENWSIVDPHEQDYIYRIVGEMPLNDLCIRNVLRACRLPETPSREQFVRRCIVSRLQL